MRDFLLWLDDKRAPHRATMVIAVGAFGLMLVGAVLGLPFDAPGVGAVVAACVASVLGIVLGMAAFAAGARAETETPWQHLKESFEPQH